MSPNAEVKRYQYARYQHFRTSDQHDNGTNRVARYDFEWNRCRVISQPSKSRDRIPQTERVACHKLSREPLYTNLSGPCCRTRSVKAAHRSVSRPTFGGSCSRTCRPTVQPPPPLQLHIHQCSEHVTGPRSGGARLPVMR